MNNKAKSLIGITIILAICILFLRISIEQLIKFNINQNESNAQSTLKLISTALENYAKDNQGLFPINLSVLSKTKPAYLDESYISQTTMKGYNYNCNRLEQSGYSCLAVPTKCRFTGMRIYTVTTGSSIISEECNKKD